MRRFIVSIPLVVVALTVAADTGAAAKRPFDVHDMVAMERISEPWPAPGGETVAFTVTTMDLEANKGRADIWVAATDGSGSRRLTTDDANDSSAVWVGDDQLLFLSTRSGSSQVWRLALSGGEARTGDRSPDRRGVAQGRRGRIGALRRSGGVPRLLRPDPLHG